MDRFWSKVAKGGPDECWPWQAGTDGRGYGLFRLGAAMVRAHRLALELHLGRAVVGDVLHRCDAPGCCNPAHLWEGSNADNVADRHAKGRDARNQTHGMRKLTDRQVAMLRQLAPHIADRHLASLFGVRRGYVYKLVHYANCRRVST